MANQETRELVRSLHRIEVALIKMLDPLKRIAHSLQVRDDGPGSSRDRWRDDDDTEGSGPDDETADSPKHEDRAIPVIRLGN